MLGKRKRAGDAHAIKTENNHMTTTQHKQDEDSESERALQRILQRHFETQFQPLLSGQKSLEHTVTPAVGLHENSETDSDFEGFDAEDEEEIQQDGVQVIDYSKQSKLVMPTKAEVKAFLNSKPLTSITQSTLRATTAQDSVEDTKTEKLNLKNDLELQRLISESHLLDPSKQAQSTNHRQKILDIRMKALGSKKSMLKQEKMPMTHRKGIIAKSKDKEVRRRKDAKDNGVILEKEIRDTKPVQKRIRGVTGPSVGKFAGGMLKLSKRDVASMTGPRKARRK